MKQNYWYRIFNGHTFGTTHLRLKINHKTGNEHATTRELTYERGRRFYNI